MALSVKPSQTITSIRNVQFKRWASLLETKGIRQTGQCLVAGTKLVPQILEEFPQLCMEILYSRQSSPRLPSPRQVLHVPLQQELFSKLDIFGTRFPLLICQVPPIRSTSLISQPQGFEVLCPFGDPANVGALIRSACAFQVSSLIFLKEAAHPFHPKSLRASSGAVFHQKMSWGVKMADLRKEEIGQWITALDVKGTPLPSWKWPKDVRLLIGEEGVGLNNLAFSRTVAIPQTTNANSLNATVAGSIALFSYRQQHPLRR